MDSGLQEWIVHRKDYLFRLDWAPLTVTLHLNRVDWAVQSCSDDVAKHLEGGVRLSRIQMGPKLRCLF